MLHAGGLRAVLLLASPQTAGGAVLTFVSLVLLLSDLKVFLFKS